MRGDPGDVCAPRAAIERERASSAPFDIAVGGRTPGDDQARARARVAPLAEAGATWWNEFLLPGSLNADGIRRRIEQGPPRIDRID